MRRNQMATGLFQIHDHAIAAAKHAALDMANVQHIAGLILHVRDFKFNRVHRVALRGNRGNIANHSQ